MSSTSHYFATVSPSAKALLLLKGLTSIPYAKQAAALVSQPEAYEPDYSNRTPGFWLRVLHFEARYHSINQLLSGLPTPVKNIIELSSGFSFRGLTLCQQQDINYVDTDLAGIIETKRQLVNQLITDPLASDDQPLANDQPSDNDQSAANEHPDANEHPAANEHPDAAATSRPAGNLQLFPLNALDEEQFNAIVDRFLPDGPIVIVNEGLLMYLEWEEKQRLCQIIRKILQRRGGYWITADIYLKREVRESYVSPDDQLSKFLEQHKVEEKMFHSFEEAETLFREQGLLIDKEATPDYSSLSVMPHLIASMTTEQREKSGQSRARFHATWRLRVAD